MPYTSLKEERWAHTAAGQKALGGAKVKEWDQASKGLKLPLYAPKRNRIQVRKRRKSYGR